MEVHVTDQVLLRLANNPQVRARAPAFNRLYATMNNRGCGKCGRRNLNNQAQVLLALKQALVNDQQLRAVVKSAVGASVLILHVRLGDQIVKRVV
jgi:hypothetical protein